MHHSTRLLPTVYKSPIQDSRLTVFFSKNRGMKTGTTTTTRRSASARKVRVGPFPSPASLCSHTARLTLCFTYRKRRRTGGWTRISDSRDDGFSKTDQSKPAGRCARNSRSPPVSVPWIRFPKTQYPARWCVTRSPPRWCAATPTARSRFGITNRTGRCTTSTPGCRAAQSPGAG